MKKRNCIVYASRLKIRDYDWKNREIGDLEKYHNFKIILQDISQIINPGFQKIFISDKIKKKVQVFSNLNNWKKKILKIKKDKKIKMKLILQMHISTFKLFNIFRFLKRKKIDTVFFPCPGHPLTTHKLDFNYLFYKFKFSLRNPGSVYIIFERNVFTILAKIFRLYPTYIIQHGKKYLPYYSKHVKVIKGSSWDYSNYLSLKKNIRVKRKYALFLEQPSPMFQADNIDQRFSKDEFMTSEAWFPSLNNFFDQLEDMTKTKIKIVAHPKVKHVPNPDYYGKREVFNHDLIKQSFYAKFLISSLSTGMGLCAAQKIPGLIIFSEQQKKNLSQKNKIYHLASELGTTPINIDADFNINEIKNALRINIKKLNLFKKNYLTSRKDNKPNHEILSEVFSNEKVN